MQGTMHARCYGMQDTKASANVGGVLHALLSYMPRAFMLYASCFSTFTLAFVSYMGSRTIAPEENCHRTPKLTLTQTLYGCISAIRGLSLIS